MSDQEFGNFSLVLDFPWHLSSLPPSANHGKYDIALHQSRSVTHIMGGYELKQDRVWAALHPVVDATGRIPLMTGG